ncbi:hypothetical protein MTR67_002860, partial [Solanum verrucosum]
QKHRTEEEEDFSDTLAVMYSEVDPVPLQIDSSSHEESLTASATVWVQSNMVKLSQHFGVDLKGCKKEAYTLLMKLDQRREKDKRLGENQMVINTSNMVAKESIWSNRWMRVIQKEAQGSSVGILVLWDKRVWNGELVLNGEQCITGRFSGVNEDFCWHLSAIYADCNRVARRALWQELLVLKNSLNGPWVVCGDFNITRYPSERTNCHKLSGAMDEFSSCIEELELVDPPLLGGSFTWRRGEDHSCASRIDRILRCAEWGDNFPHIKQSCRPKMASDHNPIILSCGGEEWKKSYFKFEIWWLEVEGFKDRVKEWWASLQLEVDGATIKDPDYIKDAVQKFYEGLYKETEQWRPGLRLHDVSRITEEEQIWLERPFDEEEIMECLNQYAMEKAPGPDVFPMVFFQTFGVF